ncbi:MAG: Re/Si-specific NAD(P)(+) transhydrogenase subunit alpha [Planctomycetes bacterium]|nr:Re/Si-specific NAD(P)(+) transhydrogenase subunit alpha [Planctomycetota bacterium]
MARVFIPKEILEGETRVAATRETVGKLKKAGLEVLVEKDAGAASFSYDDAFVQAGARVVADAQTGYAEADVVLKVREPTLAEIGLMKPDSVVIAHLVPQSALDEVRALCDRKISFFSMNLVPRISRAQSMDALSSQANIAGYKAVLLAAAALPRYFPLLTTAAGTVKAAKVVIMGAGVAGLQAIATARRLGAQVWATDVRIAVREQVMSLGAKFIDVPGMEDLEDERGYAKEATPEFLERQRQIVGDQIAESDVVVTTALIPGRKAPLLVPTELVMRMKPGSVIVDLAAEQGGNCAETVAGETVLRHGVTIVGPKNIPASMPMHASELYARNIANLFQSMVKDGKVTLDFEDEVVVGSCVTHAGEVKHAATAALVSGQGAKN